MNYKNELKRGISLGVDAARVGAKVLALGLGLVKYLAVGVAITICALALIIGLLKTNSQMEYGSLDPDDSEEVTIGPPQEG